MRKGFEVMRLGVQGNRVSDGMFVCNTLRVKQYTSVLYFAFLNSPICPSVIGKRL